MTKADAKRAKAKEMKAGFSRWTTNGLGVKVGNKPISKTQADAFNKDADTRKGKR